MEYLIGIITTSAVLNLIATILITVLTIKYNRKNLRTTKYIETITTEKIKWIENTRNDFSLLITSLLVIKNNRNKYNNIKFESERVEYVRNLTLKDGYSDQQLLSNYQNKNLIDGIDVAFQQCLTPTEIVIKSTQLKLRLKLDKNAEICEILDTITTEYSIVDFDNNNSKIELNKLTRLAQELLTIKWKKAIHEVESK